MGSNASSNPQCLTHAPTHVTSATKGSEHEPADRVIKSEVAMTALEESTLELPADMLTRDPSSGAAFSARYRSVGVKGLLKGTAVIP